jgi:hypothetical protein
MPLVLVRNTQKGPTVFSDPTANVAIEWQGAGDPNGEDVQQVPVAVTESVAFVKSLRRGIFAIESADQATLDALDAQTRAFQDRTTAAAQQALGVIDQQANNDLITVPCIGPADRGTGACGQPVPVREKQRLDKPPLCSRHEALSSQFILVEGEVDNTTGQAVRTWSRAGMSATPLPSQQ